MACLLAVLAGIFTLLLTIPLAWLLVARWKLPVLSLPFTLASSVLYLATARFTQLTAPTATYYPRCWPPTWACPLWLAGFFKAFGSLLLRPAWRWACWSAC